MVQIKIGSKVCLIKAQINKAKIINHRAFLSAMASWRRSLSSFLRWDIIWMKSIKNIPTQMAVKIFLKSLFKETESMMINGITKTIV